MGDDGVGQGSRAAGRLFAKLILGTALAAVIAPVAGLHGQAFAQSAARLHSVSLPAQPLAQSLRQLSQQTGLQIAFATGDLSGASAPAVSGTLSSEQALAQLLSGSGMRYRFTGPNTVSIQSGSGAAGGTAAADGAVPADGTLLLDTVDVAGGRWDGGVNQVEITARELELKNPRDLQEVFADEPKVAVGSSIPASQKVYVQGIEETNLSVTVDGSRQNAKVFHHNATNLIDPSLLKAVRVDAGVAPADAGPGALAGSILYETKDARDLLEPGKTFGGLIKADYDFNSDTHTIGLSMFGAENGFEYLGYINFARGSNYEAGDGSVVNGSATDLISGLGKIAYEAQSGDRFEISHEQVRDDAPRPFRANIGELTNRRPWEPLVREYTLNRTNTVFTYTDVSPEGWWDPKIVLAYTRSEVETPIFTPRENYPGSGTTGSLNGKAENRFALENGTVTAGFDFYNDKADLEARTDSSTEYARNIGVYAQARLEPWERTRLSFGARADHQWFEGTTGEEWSNGGLSGNISGEYDLIEEMLTAKAGFSHLWAGIPLAENFIFNPIWNYGDGPEPVTANNATAGLVARYNGFTVEGGIFRTDIYDARTARYAVARAIEAHDVRSEGFEVGVGYDWGVGSISVKYADIDVTIDDEPADSDLGTYLATPIGQIFTIAAVHRFEDWGLTVGGDVEIVLDYDDVPAGSQPLEGYEVVNTFVEYQPQDAPNLTFRGEIRNLFDETYVSRATYGQEFENVKPLLEPGRSFRLSATARF